MSERKLLSTILLDAGRISDDDVERALEDQRLHGGFFGEALVALGIVNRAEVDWALASQFDLPYVFPDPETVDPEAAALVTPEWALAHLAVPILRTDDSFTVVVANPLQQDVIEELQEATRLRVDLALAAPDRIRALVRALYGHPGGRPAHQPTAHSLAEFLELALAAGADRFGISVRGPDAWGWYPQPTVGAADPSSALRRLPLAPRWKAELATALQPPPAHTADAQDARRSAWSATITHGDGVATVVDAEVLAGAGGAEYLFRPRVVGATDESTGAHRLTLPAPLLAELRLLARGPTRIAVAGADPTPVRALLRALPLLVLDPPIRAVHLADRLRPGASDLGVLEITPGDDVLNLLHSYGFDAVTVDLPADAFPLAQILDAAPRAFAYFRESDWHDRLADLGIAWVLELAHHDRGGMGAWQLSSIRSFEHAHGTD